MRQEIRLLGGKLKMIIIFSFFFLNEPMLSAQWVTQLHLSLQN
jgi:hypothetical protein